MTTLTLITLVIVIYGVASRHGYGRALALGGATPAGAGVIAGATAVPTFYAVAIGAAVALGFQLLGRRGQPAPGRKYLPPGVSLLLGFYAWATLITFVSPLLFDGMIMHTPCGRCQTNLTAGLVTSSNIAQLIYLTLGVCVVVFIARSPSAGPELIGITTGTCTLLCFWRYLYKEFGVPFPEKVLDNSPAFTYIETAAGDLERFRGILSEPAGLAIVSLVTISYMLPRAAHLRGRRRIGALAVATMAGYMGVISTSATFVVGGAVIGLIAAATFTIRFLLRRASISALVGIVGCALVVVALFVLPILASFVETTINQKVSSSSYDDRSGVDATSYDVFVDTFGIGAGLGANRAAAFFPSLLSTTGLLGTLLFTATVATVIHRAAGQRAYRPVIWALVALLVVKVMSSPDLSDSSGILLISLGLLAGAAQRAGSGSPTTSAPGGIEERRQRPGTPVAAEEVSPA